LLARLLNCVTELLSRSSSLDRELFREFNSCEGLIEGAIGMKEEDNDDGGDGKVDTRFLKSGEISFFDCFWVESADKLVLVLPPHEDGVYREDRPYLALASGKGAQLTMQNDFYWMSKFTRDQDTEESASRKTFNPDFFTSQSSQNQTGDDFASV